MPATDPSRPTPFVGREHELAALTARLAAARGGDGALVLLSGEPGIGKTRMAEELAYHAVDAGFRVLWGRCWEGAGAPAFWPWIEALRPLLAPECASDLAAACAALGPAAADLATLLPELRERLDLPAPPALDPDQARFRLFESVSLVLRALAARRPLLLVLDDLHWADAGSLLLLQFLARDLASVSLLVLGSYRDAEVDRQHPLSETLAALRRQPVFSRLPLRGLAPEAVLSVLHALAPAAEGPTTAALARALYDDTEGNPFFIQEVLRHLHESGRQAFDAEGLRGAGVPDGVREVIGRRLARLSPGCLQTLRVAAVIGREFSAAVLRAALDAGEAPPGEAGLAEALDEAETASVIQSVPQAPGDYRFVHALMRETLYEELATMRRIRLHRQVGRALVQRHAADLEPHLAELAHHFAQAATLYAEDAPSAIAYATRAAERSGRLLAYEEAVRHYEMALRSLELEEHGPSRRRCDLLLALGEAEARAGRSGAARQRFAQAADLARTLTDRQRFARAALGFGGPVVTVGVVDLPLVRLLEEALAGLGGDESPLRARLLGRLAMELLYAEEAGAPRRRDRLSAEAVAMARRCGDAAALGFALNARHYAIWEPATLPERLAAATEIVQIGEAGGNADLAMQGRRWRIPDLLEANRRADADAEVATLERLANEARQPLYRWYTAVFRAAQALLDGRFAEAEALIDAAYAAGELAHSGTARIYERGQRMVLLRELDRLDELEAWLRGAMAPTLPVFRCWLAWHCAASGRQEEARQHLARLAAESFRPVRRDLTWLAATTSLAETCAVLDARDQAAQLYTQMLPYAGWNAMMGIPVYLGSVERPLGLLAATLGRWEAAAGHFEAALTANARLGAHGWLAHTRHDYARMLLARGRPDDALRSRALLHEAAEAAQTLGMVWLARRLAAERAAAVEAPLRPPAGLTPRELEVLRLIAAGRTTREIASALVVSEPTVERHITNLYAKIGARGRADATAFALRQGLGERNEEIETRK